MLQEQLELFDDRLGIAPTMLTQKPTNGNPQVYITIFEGAGGWNCGVFKWVYDDFGGFYEPQVTGLNNTSLGDGSRDGAIKEAMNWAVNEDLPLWVPSN